MRGLEYGYFSSNLLRILFPLTCPSCVRLSALADAVRTIQTERHEVIRDRAFFENERSTTELRGSKKGRVISADRVDQFSGNKHGVQNSHTGRAFF